MKNYIFLILIAFISNFALSQKTQDKTQIAEVACGLCQFDRTDKKGCNLAVKINKRIYFVEGTGIDDHGDAHAKDGFCNAIRKAKIIGEIKDGKFAVSYFKLLPSEKEKLLTN